ncbi:MAG TPA: single-stranded-DNA-specific exonuclease RecJ [Steroidobacteraceae bacterium]|nr:single-stranded-DNA-specific exonuclease RecJ [Steroidobacteraceae bacterium]
MTPRVIRRRGGSCPPEFAPHLNPVVRRVYAARGLHHQDELNLGLDHLLPVSSLAGVERATDLLLAHRERPIVVVGDFDADGATSTALVVRSLRRLGFPRVSYLVPNRFRFGYGLTPEIVTLAAAREPALLITVDNGISSHAGVAEANRRGIDVLVTDHHLPGAELPAAAAIVNPNLAGSAFGSRALAGVGAAFYVMAALQRRLRETNDAAAGAPSVADFLDLVALGTVADLVPLDRNNRVLVSQGLRRIRAGRCAPGITALLEQAGRRASTLVAQDLGFAVAPRLNAAGRIDDMSIGIECLLADEVTRARELAARLSDLNEERRSIEQRMQAEALDVLSGIDVRADRVSALCLYDPSWHQGVVGLVASRVKDRYHRPVIAWARAEEGWLRGSARSVEGVHIRDVLDAVATRHPGLIEKFGGHAMAAGLTLREPELARFEQAFLEETGRWLDLDAEAVVDSDGELAPAEMTLATALELREAGPWGQAFPEPAFDGEFRLLESKVVGERHVRFRVQPLTSGEAFEAIAFNFLSAERGIAEAPAGRARLAYRLDVNEYLGTRRLQLVVEHLESA